MNIQEAKDQIKNAVRAYLSKDDTGRYAIPRSRQRPLLLMGAPGLGKTAIMGQIAAELDIGLVSYTITHHTRQSAIGLPMIEKETYGGKEYTVTKYTMSEIISSVYDAIRDQGRSEGILFIDEINCASETLAPSMLDLLQNKKFGPHRIPDGWVLVAAGNPHEFNDSAREFDVATLDRVRMIDVQPDTEVWLRYAMDAGIDDSILYYLKIKPQNLLRIERTVDGRFYVTPRAWEDLSVVLNESEGEGLALISQYIRDPEIASEYSRYRDFYRKYREDVDVHTILSGRQQSSEGMDADGKLAVVTMLIDALNSEASELLGLKNASAMYADRPSEEDISKLLEGEITAERRKGLECLLRSVRAGESAEKLEERTRLAHDNFSQHISNAVSFMETNYGSGPETVFLLTGLLSCSSVVLVSEPGNPLYELNDRLLIRGRDRRMQGAV
ncbi:MAG: AAA family ATPase [Candidatus Methanomethylophilaceae archaeon]|nr:AAA family ATPase [Candidatus Methanomethylophilaceae archaeon]